MLKEQHLHSQNAGTMWNFSSLLYTVVDSDPKIVFMKLIL